MHIFVAPALRHHRRLVYIAPLALGFVLVPLLSAHSFIVWLDIWWRPSRMSVQTILFAPGVYSFDNSGNYTLRTDPRVPEWGI